MAGDQPVTPSSEPTWRPTTGSPGAVLTLLTQEYAQCPRVPLRSGVAAAQLSGGRFRLGALGQALSYGQPELFTLIKLDQRMHFALHNDERPHQSLSYAVPGEARQGLVTLVC